MSPFGSAAHDARPGEDVMLTDGTGPFRVSDRLREPSRAALTAEQIEVAVERYRANAIKMRAEGLRVRTSEVAPSSAWRT